MDAFIKTMTDKTENYNRFGKVIPKVETRISIEQFFGVDHDRAKFIAQKLLNDDKISFILAKEPTPTNAKEREEIKKNAANESQGTKDGENKKGAKKKADEKTE